MKPDLDILVPARNEAKNLPELLLRIKNSFANSDIKYRVLIIDDNSTDGTEKLVSSLSSEYPVVLIKKHGLPGKASAIIQGSQNSEAEIQAMIDADLEYPPEALPQMYKQLVDNNFGVVVGNRANLHNSYLRSLGSKINRFLMGKFLLGFSCDVQSGLKVFRKEIVSHLDPKSIGAWAIDMPLLFTATQLGLSLGSQDIQFTPRTAGESKCKQEFFTASKQIILGALKLRLSSHKIYSIPSTDPKTSIGSGLAHKGARFITHTQLHHHESAFNTLMPWQKYFLLSLISFLVFGLLINPLLTGITFIGLLSLLYFFDCLFTFIMIYRSLNRPPQLSFTQEQISQLDNDQLPIYSILCPLYKEAKVLPDFLHHISDLDWPKNKLDVILLLESDDSETLNACKNLNLPSYIRVLEIPHSLPKTKPKACNYGLGHAKGEFIVIYDAEDQPEKFQLKKAYLGFINQPDKVICLQAKLNYFNPRQNLLTRLFTAEYSLWFDVVLPGYQSLDTVIPLGGTSNHFKAKYLKELQGWDAFNVTEDCDLGARLFKHGYRTGLIDSVTLEEANSNLGNWLRQRSRWIKGYIQTWLVHNRHPLKFIKTHGSHAFFFQLVVGGKTAFTLINPFLWTLTILYFTAYKVIGPTIEALYPSYIFYIAGFSAVFGNFLFLYYYMIGLGKRNEWDLVKYVFLIPLYWLAVSVAASKAFTQLIFKPHYWEKTHHGLHLTMRVRNQNVVKKDIKIDLLPQFKFALGRYIFPVISIGFWTSLMAMGLSLTYKNSIISILIIFGCAVGYILTIYLSKVVQLIKQLSAGLKNNILVSGSLLIGSSFIANFCNFLYNAYLGRQVSAEEFGLVSLMGSLFYLTTIPTSALYRTITHRTAYLLGKNHESPKEFWKYLVNITSKISILTTVIWLVLTPYLSKVFHSNNVLAFILFTPVWFVSLIGAVNAGYLNGNHKFSSLGLLTIIDSIVKLVLTWTFVSHGLTPWVYAAVPLSLIPSFAAGWLMSNRIPAPTSKTITLNMVHFPKKFFATSVIVSLSTLVFLSVDVILAKTFLSPVIAGQYSLLSLAGKMVYFIGTLFSQFIIPVISKVEGKNLKSGGHFNKLFAATISSSFIGFVLIGVFGKYTVPVLFGQQALSIVPYLQWFTLSMGAFGAATAIVNYRQTQKHYVFPLIGFCFSLLHVGLILMNHSSITDFVEAAVITSLSYLLVITFIHTFFDSIKTVGLNLLDFLRLFNQLPKQSSANTQSLRILILNWYDISHKWAGGAEIYIHEIAKRWVQEGHFVTMFTGNDQTQPESQIIDGVQVVRRGGQFTVAIWAFIYYVFKFRGNFDVIVDVPKGVPFFTPLYSQTPKVCLIHQVHQDMFRTELRFPARQIALFLEAVLMPLVYRNIPFVAVSPSTKLAIQNIGLGNVGIDIVYPGVDIKKYPVKKTSYPSIVYVGRLRPYKNIDLIIHAISQIKSEFPNILLNIAGMGEDQDRLKQIVKDLNVSRHVKFLGRVSEKAKSQILTSSWIAVQPSMVEGWGITNIEANSCGTPVIAANTDGLKDSVINNVTGLLISPKSSQALATAIRRLINNKALRNKLSRSAVDWAAKFNWELSSQQLLKSVYGALNSRPKFRLSFYPAFLKRGEL